MKEKNYPERSAMPLCSAKNLVGMTVIPTQQCDTCPDEQSACKKLILADGTHICLKATVPGGSPSGQIEAVGLNRLNKGIMEREKIEKRVNDVLNDVLGVAYSEIKDDAVLETDLCVDSLDAVEIVMGLEHEFGISIPEEKMYNNEGCTVKDVYDLVKELL